MWDFLDPSQIQVWNQPTPHHGKNCLYVLKVGAFCCPVKTVTPKYGSTHTPCYVFSASIFFILGKIRQKLNPEVIGYQIIFKNMF